MEGGISIILPRDAWAYLLGLCGCKTLWCLPGAAQPDCTEGFRYLLREGLALVDGKDMMLEPDLLATAQQLAQGKWGLHFEYGAQSAAMVAGEQFFLLIRRISAVLYRIELYQEKAVFFDTLYEQIMSFEWEEAVITAVTPTQTIGQTTVAYDQFSAFFDNLRQDR